MSDRASSILPPRPPVLFVHYYYIIITLILHYYINITLLQSMFDGWMVTLRIADKVGLPFPLPPPPYTHAQWPLPCIPSIYGNTRLKMGAAACRIHIHSTWCILIYSIIMYTAACTQPSPLTCISVGDKSSAFLIYYCWCERTRGCPSELHEVGQARGGDGRVDFGGGGDG